MTQEEVYELINNHYRENASRLVKVISYMLGNSYIAEEVVQETYTRACDYWYTYNDDNFNSWINTIRGNALKDKIGEERMHGMVEDKAPDISFNHAFKGIYLKDMQKLIDAQKPNVKRILDLFFMKQMSHAAIKAVVPESRTNIETIIWRFRQNCLRPVFGTSLFDKGLMFETN